MAKVTGGVRSLEISEFLGVDFSSSPLNVDKRRAVDAENFLCDNGITRKRSGWEQRLKIERDGKPCRINGMFEYKLMGRYEVIVHAGVRFYRLGYDEWGEMTYTDITASGTHAPSAVDAAKIKDTRSQAFYSAGRMYIVGCGDYLVYGTWDDGQTFELRRVKNGEDTYIPTTTININRSNDESVKDVRATLDSVNYLSDYRKNSLVGPPPAEEGYVPSGTYYLDTSIDEGTEVIVQITLADGSEVTLHTDPTSSTPDKLIGHNKIAGSIASREKGRINLSGEPIATTGQEDTIIVTFRHAVEGYAERVEGASFGILFGIEGNTDRLFVSGNEDYPNADFFTAMDDFTYFEDTNTVTLGSDSFAILGYARLSDSTLAIFKEKSEGEASIFYRTGYYSDKFDANGNLDKILPIFPTTAGNIGESVISRHACVDFGGDNLILSENGVFGIVLSENVATAARYTRERSRSVNARLCKERNLSEAVGISYKNRYYLCVNGHCYVADARYRRRAQDSLDNSYSYEWWYLTNMPARVFSDIGGALWFGTEDGMICTFHEGFADRVCTYLEEGEAIFNDLENVISYSDASAAAPFDGDMIRFYTNGLYALYATNFSRVEGERIYVDEDTILRIYDGERVYADFVEGTALAVGTEYVIDDVDAGECSFRLIDASGAAVSPGGAGFRLCRRIDGGDYYITQVNEYAHVFKISTQKGGQALDLVLYNGATAVLPRAKVTKSEAVRAKWYTPISNLGTAEYDKELLSMTVTCEPGVVGEMQAGYETRFASGNAHVYGAERGFSLESLSFESFSFDTGFASSFTVRLRERHVNYVALRFLSDTESDCAPGSVSLQYKINQKNRGVM